MKRSAFHCTKMKRFCQMLGIRQYVAVGILESLWNVTAREAPQGNIGKLSDDDIALAIDYEGDPGGLMRALVTARWVDESADHRLVIHDWHDHADDAVKKLLARQKLPFVSRHVETCRDISRLPVPVPVPVPKPEPEPVPVGHADASIPDLTDAFNELWEAWPAERRRRKVPVQQKLAEIVTQATDPRSCIAAIRRNAAGYLQSEDVRRGICFGLERWLCDGHWMTEYSAPESRRTISADELELLYAARRTGGDE